jgi:beta-carotene 3-hydroxylase
MLTNTLLFLAALAGMEIVANLTHRYVMHGWLWSLHASHHRPREGMFEKNDLFAVLFSVPSILLIYLGVNVYPPLLWIGLGMTAYGLVYFVFHDVIVHRRIRLPYRARSRYLKRIIQAHWIHHATREREGAVSFGFLYAPPIEDLKRARTRAEMRRA